MSVSAYRVLLVDDDTFFLKVYGGFLRSHGFEVDLCASGAEAEARYAQGRYELLIVDLVLPDISGLELIERIRGQNPAQDVIVVTATGDVRVAVRAMRLGVYDYLVKPIEREELLLVIDRLQERSTLYDEHARLLDENIRHSSMQQIYQRALRIMESLDLESVCERLLETLAEVSAAQGVALWLSHKEGTELSLHGYRGLLEPGTLPLTFAPTEMTFATELCGGLPVLTTRDITAGQRQAELGEAMLVPLAKEHRLFGVAALFDKLGGGFNAQDLARARIIADFSATAVAHARRYQHLERVGLRDPATSAYNMTFFVDYLGRELYKARRYQRSFSLVQITIDTASGLKHSVSPAVFREAMRQIVLVLGSALRDIDVLAQVSDGELFLLSPETDFQGARGVIRAARDAIAGNAAVRAIDEQHPVSVSFGAAAFPRDGDDVDQLFAACRRRLDEARRSLFRRLHLDDLDFWGAVELLVGEPRGHADARKWRVTEDEKGLSRHAVFPPELVSFIREDVLREASRQAHASGWLFLGGPSLVFDERTLRSLRVLESGALRSYAVVSEAPVAAVTPSCVTAVVAGEWLRSYELVLLLAEHAAYGLLGRLRDDGSMEGFHTADWTLVEGLIGKLQDAYHLQKGAA